MAFALSPGQLHDGPQGRKLLKKLGPVEGKVHLMMDKAYESNQTLRLAVEMGYIPVVPPKRSRKDPWEYDTELYKRRNEVERLFRCIKRFRRIFTRYDKLDVMYLGFVTFGVIVDALRRSVNTP